MQNKQSQQGKVIIILLGVLIIGGALGIARYWMKNKPKAKKNTEIVKIIPIVETVTLQAINHQINIVAMGNVVAARKINLISQVKGEVINTHSNFLPGGIINKGQTLIKINPVDYELIKLQKNSEVEKAKNDLTIEMGKQSVAKKEYKLLGADLAIKDQELILRKPQLRLTKANLVSAEAKLKQAQLDLTRTNIKVPFNALVENTNVQHGSWQNIGSNLASIIDIDQYWVDVSLPIDRLSLLDIPEFNADKASKVVIKYPAFWKDKTRSGLIKRLKPNIDNKVRMAQLIIEVNDPLSIKKSNKDKPKLLIGSFVEVNLAGKELKNVLAIPRKALRDGNKLWLLDDNSQLNIVTSEILWKNKTLVYIDAKSIKNNAKIITSDLSSPIQSMQLGLKKTTDE